MKHPYAKSPEELGPLKALVQAGKLRDVEAWLGAAKPVFCPSAPKRQSIIEIAARTGFHSMVEALAAVWPDKHTLDKALDRALAEKHPDVAELLLDQGADVTHPALYDVAECYTPALMRTFLERGADVSDCDNLAEAITARVRPLCRTYKECCPDIPGADIQLAKALKYFVGERIYRWIGLTLWMGADPRLRVPEIMEERDDSPTCALEDAYNSEDYETIKMFKLDPSRDDPDALLNMLYGADMRIIKPLLAAGANLNNKPNGGSAVLEHCLSGLSWRCRAGEMGKGYDPREGFEELAELGAKFIPDDKSDFRYIRDHICGMSDHETYWLLGTLAKTTSWEVMSKLLRPPRVVQHIGCGPKQLLLWLGYEDSDASERTLSEDEIRIINDDPATKRGANVEFRPVKISRQQLYEEIWEQPVQKVARKYGISDVGLAKICRKHDIPRPPRGHWAKTAARRPVETIPLPEPGREELVTIGICHSYQRRDPADIAADSPEPPRIEVPVPETLTDPHRAVRRARKLLRKAPLNRDDMLEVTDQACLDIVVSKRQLPRALLIMDSLIKALINAGLKFCPPESPKKAGAVVINGETIPFGLHEETETYIEGPLTVKQYRAKHGRNPGYLHYKHRPSGVLVLSLPTYVPYGQPSPRHNWRDTKLQRLENILSSFIWGLYRAADRKVEARRREDERKAEEAEKAPQKAEQERKQAEKMRKYEEEKARYDAERERVRKLTDNATDWRKAENIRQYVLAVQERAREKGDPIDPGSERGRWITWALNQADRLDPMTESPPSLLDDPPEKPAFGRSWF